MERFLLSVQAECLDHFVILGPAHLCYLVESFLRHYHEDRPHQGLGNQTLAPRVATPSPRWEREDVVYHESLGALLKSDSWRAAA